MSEESATPTEAYPVTSQRPAELSIQDLVYYQTGDEQPVVNEYRQVRLLRTDEEPYTRNPALGEAWRQLDLGWLTGQSVSLITIHNSGPPEPEFNPTATEQSQLDAKVVEVSLDGGRTPHLVLGRGDSCRFLPLNPAALSLRCRSGATKVKIAVYPG